MFDGSFEENDAIIRFKGNMADQNTAMRDPTLFRIINGDHPKLGTKVRVWPTYDFAAPIEDSLDGVTHALRTKEYELRNALYFAVLEALGMRKPYLAEFSRLEFEGIPVSKRKIKPLIQEGVVAGWDDPRLPTLSAFRKRGFTPQGIRQFVLSLGISLAETKPPFEALEAFNRKVIDPTSPRLFFVDDPYEIKINGGPAETRVELRNHPTNLALGSRFVQVHDSVLISSSDAENLAAGHRIRLIELFNIRIISLDTRAKLVKAEYSGNDIERSMAKVQWVAKNDIVDFAVLTPKELFIGDHYNTNSLTKTNGYAESYVRTLGIGTIIQFVRFGFCRIEKEGLAVFAHK
jgi:glutamyl-tRNA synthetase